MTWREIVHKCIAAGQPLPARISLSHRNHGSVGLYLYDDEIVLSDPDGTVALGKTEQAKLRKILNDRHAKAEGGAR